MKRLVLVLWLTLCIGDANAQSDILTGRADQGVNFLIQLSGTANRERFQNIQAILKIEPNPEGKENPYLIVTLGKPFDNAANSFYFNSDDAKMDALSTTIRCELRSSAIKQPVSHFYHLSPSLFKIKGFRTQHDDEDIARTKKIARPTRIAAQSGRFEVTVNAGRVQGFVELTGYDFVGKEIVRYQANFSGEAYTGPAQPIHEVWKTTSPASKP